ncbi:uncharacterized protein LOC122796720 [Protopterus annectens]|uniref:uncharacterized protein LOC122796720 n=1 Tax=Protopterus annectens TaxID=7888 RepID=UPI001CFAC691|nr:uncharacterized protein LOC122796720 [Protopterus annectens]
MVFYCVVGYCRNIPGDGIALFKFPSREKSPVRYSKWVDYVKTTRTWNDTAAVAPHICSAHFSDDQFENVLRVRMKFGKTLKLKRMAIPDVAHVTEFLHKQSSNRRSRSHCETDSTANRKRPHTSVDCDVTVKKDMPGCFAKGCATHSGRLQEGQSMYSFPKDKELCITWLTRCGTDVESVSEFVSEVTRSKIPKYYLCSSHFEEQMFEQNYMLQLQTDQMKPLKVRRHLVPGAVPTIFNLTRITQHHQLQVKSTRHKGVSSTNQMSHVKKRRRAFHVSCNDEPTRDVAVQTELILRRVPRKDATINPRTLQDKAIQATNNCTKWTLTDNLIAKYALVIESNGARDPAVKVET